MTVIETVRLIAKEFDNVSDETLNSYIELYKPLVSKKIYGKLYNLAIAYLVCHKMKMTGLGENELGATGSMAMGYTASSVSDGGSSISFANSGQSNLATNAEFASTIYGTQFLQLKKMVVVPIHISGEGDFS